MSVAVMTLAWTGVILLSVISNHTAARYMKINYCEKYFEDHYECENQCKPLGKCKEILFSEITKCFVCEGMQLFNVEQCNGIYYTGLCRKYFAFDSRAYAASYCKHNRFYWRKYEEDSITCFHCTLGLFCEDEENTNVIDTKPTEPYLSSDEQ